MDWIKVRQEKIDKFRVGLHPEYQKIYDAICSKLPPAWAPYCGLRTVDEQHELYMKGRSKESVLLGERIVTNAKPGESFHNYGMASDWTIWDLHGQPFWNHSEWNIYGAIVRQSGGQWAGDWITFKEKPHNQMSVILSGREINEFRLTHGFDAAVKYILDHRRL